MNDLNSIDEDVQEMEVCSNKPREMIQHMQ